MKKIICTLLTMGMLLGAFARAASVDLPGAWYLITVVKNETEYSPADLDLEMTLSLNEDGTVLLTTVDEEDMEGTWTAVENGVQVIFDGEELLFILQDGRLTISEADLRLVFSRDVSEAFDPGIAIAAESLEEFKGTWSCVKIKTADRIVDVDSLWMCSTLTIDYLVKLENHYTGSDAQDEYETHIGYGLSANGVLYLFGDGLDGIRVTLYDSGMLETVQHIADGTPLTCYYEQIENEPPQEPDFPPISYKPVIYLYPERETDVNVLLHYDGELTCTWPAYGDGWSVRAQPDGTLTDSDGKEYSYLFWEGMTNAEYDFSKGFCVPGHETAEFLRSALEALGLTPREYNEFIVFWLPRMQENPYNLIAFQGDCYTERAKLEISPEPDTVLRVFMAYRPLKEPIQIEPQELCGTPREGFAVVEWGGSMV